MAQNMHNYEDDIWIFAYGSLMWHPEIPFIESKPAMLHGYHRALCMYSFEYRGTPEKPGLVFGLDRGGACNGLAFKVEKSQAKSAVSMLNDRELINDIYQPKWLTVKMDDRSALAYCFVAARDHEQYAGVLSEAEQVRLVNQGCGKRGQCIEYLTNTFDHLQELGIIDRKLERIVSQVRLSVKTSSAF